MTDGDAPDWERTAAERLPAGLGGLWYGVYPAVVTDVRDPEGQGRVKVSLPWAGHAFDLVHFDTPGAQIGRYATLRFLASVTQ